MLQTDNADNSGSSEVPTFDRGSLVTFFRSYNSARLTLGSQVNNSVTDDVAVSYDGSVPNLLYDDLTLDPQFPSGPTRLPDSTTLQIIGQSTGRVGTDDIAGGFDQEQVGYLCFISAS